MAGGSTPIRRRASVLRRLAVACIGAAALSPVAAAYAEPQIGLEGVPTPSNNRTPSFGGGTSDELDPVTVAIYTGSTVESSALRETLAPTTPFGMAWSAGPSETLSDGVYTAQASQTDEGGEGHSDPVSFTIDTSSPTVALNQPPALSSNTKPTFSGTASDIKPVVVEIFNAGHSKVASATASGSGGAWSSSNEPSLASGSYTAVATQESSLGNPAGESNEVSFTIDTSSPTVALNQPPALSSNTKPTFSGTASDIKPVVVEIFNAGHSKVASATASGTGGVWSAGNEASLTSGSYTAVAKQESSLGNPPGKSNEVSFTIDTAPPSVSLAPGSSEKHTATPRFEGTAGTAPGDLPTVTLNIYAGSAAAGTPVRAISGESKGGKWSTVTSPPLQNGTYTAQAEQSDQAGNRGLSTPPSTFTISSNGPVVTLTPIAGETNNSSPSFSGSAGLANGKVRLQVYPGPHASGGTPARTVTVVASGSTWSSGPVAALPDGTYTAIAEESDALKNIGVSGEATFTVDTASPGVSLSSPGNGSSASGASQLVEGLAGTTAGDAATITVRLASGSSIEGQTLQTRVVANEGGHWHLDFEGLAPGSYTTQAEQSDAAGNRGLSQAVTFTLTPAPAGGGAAPTASFTWVPSSPRVGQTVSLLSSSSDLTSAIIGYAWDLTGSGTYTTGTATNSTTFTTSGNHVVHLHVSAADGLSSVATETIPVLPASYALMRPFPIVRITSIDTRSGIRLRILRVQAPNGSRISVTCRNRGCPAKSQQKLAAAATTGVAAYTFHKFERALRAGVILEIRVSAANQIGKYTRLTIRKGRLPQRVDLCLSPGGAKTIVCPS
jgi:hypothetical protein